MCASSKLQRLSGSSSSGIGPLASLVMTSIGDGASEVTGISGVNSVGEDKLMMSKVYRAPLPDQPRW